MNKHLPLKPWVYYYAFLKHYQDRLKTETREDHIIFLTTAIKQLTK